jgi:hypothetical protein
MIFINNIYRFSGTLSTLFVTGVGCRHHIESVVSSLRLRGVARHEAKQEAIQFIISDFWIASLRSQ